MLISAIFTVLTSEMRLWDSPNMYVHMCVYVSQNVQQILIHPISYSHGVYW